MQKTKTLFCVVALFAIVLCGCGVDRTVAKKIKEPGQMPEVVFWSFADFSDVAEEGELQGRWTFCDKNGNFYISEDKEVCSWNIVDVMEQYTAGNLTDKIELRATCDAAEVFENYQKLCKISKNKDYKIVRPDSGPAVQTVRGGWRGGYYDKDGKLQSKPLYQYDAHGQHNANDKLAGEIVEWLGDTLTSGMKE